MDALADGGIVAEVVQEYQPVCFYIAPTATFAFAVAAKLSPSPTIIVATSEIGVASRQHAHHGSGAGGAGSGGALLCATAQYEAGRPPG